MTTRYKSLAESPVFKYRIYSIFLSVTFYGLFLNLCVGQEIGSYKTVASGNFRSLSIWQVYDGTHWSPASTIPNQSNDVYIDKLTKLSLITNEEVKSLFINSQSGAGEKLSLNGFNLTIYGSLQAFTGAAPGTSTGSFPSTNWIGNSRTSTITFKGESRIILPDGAWSAQSTNSRYSVVFDPGPGVELTLQEAFKALGFTVKSGTVFQRINTNSVPNLCATFSFNTNSAFGTDEFGDFIIEEGAELRSECNSTILYRTGSSSNPRPASLFDLQPGGELILTGTSPQIEAASLQLNGKVIFKKEAGVQNFLSKSYTNSEEPSAVHDLEIQGSSDLNLPLSLSIRGNMSQGGTGKFNLSTTALTFSGIEDQLITGFALDAYDLILEKPSGEVVLEEDLTVRNVLNMKNGGMNLQGKKLTINSLGSGGLVYAAGHWVNVSEFSYQNIPVFMTAPNFTFPFYDQYQGGIRMVQLLGTSAGGNLNVKFVEQQGADYNPGFNDSDGTPILYRLYSYFRFSGLNASSNPLELRISADKLIVDQPEDLRLVGTGYAAPGNHIESADTINLWAIRKINFNDLPAKNFTVGSSRTLSILPIIWLETRAERKLNSAKISWIVTGENSSVKFEIYRFENLEKEPKRIGIVTDSHQSEEPTSFEYYDHFPPSTPTVFYQIRLLSLGKQTSTSNVFRLEGNFVQELSPVIIYPNPYVGHLEPKLLFAESLPATTSIEVLDLSGKGILSFGYEAGRFADELSMLPSGVYLIRVFSAELSLTLRWIKM